jgi:predicted transcriptional regulator
MERPDLYVVARFLDRLAEAGPAGKTDLQLRVRVNYTIFQRYVAWLVERGFVAAEGQGRGQTLRLTAAGLDAQRRLAAWIRDVVGAL